MTIEFLHPTAPVAPRRLARSVDLRPAVGRLTLQDGRATLEGAQGAKPRSYEFEAQEVERCELASDLRRRLNGRPTLAVALKHRGRLLIAGAIGFGQTAEIAD